VEVVKALVGLGADVHTQLPSGHTALHLAAHQGQAEVVKALVQRGADLDAVDSWGRSALALATAEGHTQVAQWLTAYAATRAALAAATQEPPCPPPPPPRRRGTPRVCAQCGASEWAEGGRLHKCGGCLIGPPRERYCSKACQERHWPEHRERCSGRVAQ